MAYSGHHFDEASLPTPIIQHDATSTYASLPNRASASPDGFAHAAVDSDARATEASLSSLPGSFPVTDEMSTTITSRPSVVLRGDPMANPSLSTESGSAPPGMIAPPEPEDEANLTDTSRKLLELEIPHQPARTVHLPPENVQLDRLRERAEERRRNSSVDVEKPSRLSHVHTQPDGASSPSSTIGAYSAATPMPTQDSPDTSPDSEPVRVEIPQDLRPTVEEQRAKFQHDHQLAAQKEIARQQALGEVNTPDDQLKWEEREAAAREAEERAAREDVVMAGQHGESAEVNGDSKMTGRVVSSGLAANTNHLEAQAVKAHSPQGQDKASAVQSDDEDNITITSRFSTSRPKGTALSGSGSSVKPHNADSLATQSQSRDQAALRSSLTLRPEATAQPAARRRASSTEPISPKTSRRTLQPARPMLPQTPNHVRASFQQHSSPAKSFVALSELVSLKGAAEDPDRDYLEPLFRIQAHESPNISTTILPELVKSARKTLSTEDYFTTTHERMDFRMLRRIYQLQNANKWPLRQMEKCREPPQPVTHYDHVMAEMKWMSKDFHAERKMKKSVAAWLAQRCAEWVAAGAAERRDLQIKIKPRSAEAPPDEPLPELDLNGDSAPEDEGMPGTPRLGASPPLSLVVDPELFQHVHELQAAGSLGKALKEVPRWQPLLSVGHVAQPMAQVSKFVTGKVLPTQQHPSRKRSRYDYEQEDEPEEHQSGNKRRRSENDLPPEDLQIALFHPDNKHIRDRLHANNAFRPPSQHPMPGSSFYDNRSGSQWTWDDDAKLRKLTKEYSFNWALIADGLALSSRYTGGMERRSDWECFERWVELETMPVEMRKTVYFKTWGHRLAQSEKVAERRHEAQVAAAREAHQQSGASGQQLSIPARRKTVPSRVEKRKNTRHLWTVDAMRKLARKREAAAYKQAEGRSLSLHNMPGFIANSF
jgi:chromatin modification-related protein VID21